MTIHWITYETTPELDIKNIPNHSCEPSLLLCGDLLNYSSYNESSVDSAKLSASLSASLSLKPSP